MTLHPPPFLLMQKHELCKTLVARKTAPVIVQAGMLRAEKGHNFMAVRPFTNEAGRTTMLTQGVIFRSPSR